MKQVTHKLLPKAVRPLLPPSLALRTLTSKSGKGVYASSDTLFKGAVFGRDSIEVAEDLLPYKRGLVKNIIKTLSSLQGEETRQDNEEEPGKIIHEYRTTVVDGRPIKGITRHIFDELSARWGGTNDSLAYYGSVDATPHFIRLVNRYVEQYGKGILNQHIRLRSGYILTLNLLYENSLDWVLNRLAASDSGLIEYKRMNPEGIENQVWKDSKEFYVHESGELANHHQPIASIEVQGLAYDALWGAASLIPARTKELQERAEQLRDKTIELLWQPDKHYFALGVDYTEDGSMRVINTHTANPAALLDTGFFDQLSDEDKQKYVRSIVTTIMGHDFLTDAGIRSRGLNEAGLVSYWDYHGSFVTWPKETYDIAKGLHRHGFGLLARQLENRLLNIVLRSKQYPEFIYVDKRGRVLASSPSAHEHGRVMLVDSTNKPEIIQAWTVSAVMAIVSSRLRRKIAIGKVESPPEWVTVLQERILAEIPHVNRMITPNALSARYPEYSYSLVRNNAGKPFIDPQS